MEYKKIEKQIEDLFDKHVKPEFPDADFYRCDIVDENLCYIKTLK